MKFLLVGCEGYLGKNLGSALKKSGVEVFSTSTKASDAQNIFTIDFSNPVTFNKLTSYCFDVVVILAARLDSLKTTSLSHPDLKSNAFDYGVFLEFLSGKSLVKKLIYISSMTVYGSDNQSPVPESGILQPFHIYGLSKLLAERVTEFWARANGIPSLTLRIPGLYGGIRKAGLIYNTAIKAKAGEPILIDTKGLVYWETLHVTHLSETIVSLLGTYTWKNIYDCFNLGYGICSDVYNVVKYINAYFGNQSEIIEERQKGYKEFFLSTSKVSEFVPIKGDLFSGLEQYLKSLNP